MPLVDPAGDGVWARVVCSDAGSDRGVMIRPEIDDEVVVGFFDDDPRSPVLLGMLHSSAHAAPLTPSNDNHEKTFKSRSGIQVLVNDEDTVITLSTPGGHSFVLDDKNGEVVLTDSNGNSLKFSSAGITIESSADLKLKVSADAKLEFGGSGEVSAGTQLKLEGSAGIEVSSGGTAKLKGSLVQIN